MVSFLTKPHQHLWGVLGSAVGTSSTTKANCNMRDSNHIQSVIRPRLPASSAFSGIRVMTQTDLQSCKPAACHFLGRCRMPTNARAPGRISCISDASTLPEETWKYLSACMLPCMSSCLRLAGVQGINVLETCRICTASSSPLKLHIPTVPGVRSVQHISTHGPPVQSVRF